MYNIFVILSHGGSVILNFFVNYKLKDKNLKKIFYRKESETFIFMFEYLEKYCLTKIENIMLNFFV